jgi:hypothetical protein
MTTRFEFFEGPKSEAQEPQVTVRKSGQMVLTPPAVAMLGDEVTHVQFGYDPDSGAVALRAAPEEAKGRYRLREQSNGSSLVDGRRFLGHHGLKVEKARRFPAEELGDGMVGFRLTGERSEDDNQTAAKGKSTRSTKRKAAATA